MKLFHSNGRILSQYKVVAFDYSKDVIPSLRRVGNSLPSNKVVFVFNRNAT